jgi:hypothetical protein
VGARSSHRLSYRLDNRHCAGEAKNSDEKQVVVSQRNATTKARKQGKRDQLSKAWRHIHAASDLKNRAGLSSAICASAC